MKRLYALLLTVVMVMSSCTFVHATGPTTIDHWILSDGGQNIRVTPVQLPQILAYREKDYNDKFRVTNNIILKMDMEQSLKYFQKINLKFKSSSKLGTLTLYGVDAGGVPMVRLTLDTCEIVSYSIPGHSTNTMPNMPILATMEMSVNKLKVVRSDQEKMAAIQVNNVNKYDTDALRIFIDNVELHNIYAFSGIKISFDSSKPGGAHGIGLTTYDESEIIMDYFADNEPLDWFSIADTIERNFFKNKGEYKLLLEMSDSGSMNRITFEAGIPIYGGRESMILSDNGSLNTQYTFKINRIDCLLRTAAGSVSEVSRQPDKQASAKETARELLKQDWTDTWNTSYGDIIFDAPNRNQVVGHYNSNVGTLTGTMSISAAGKAVLSGIFSEGNTTDSKKGYFEFIMSDDKQFFTGYWRSEEDDPSSKTEWNGERAR